MTRTTRVRGFTLLEVLVALVIVTLSVGALLGSVSSSASHVIYLKEKTLAEWVALNRLTEIRIDQVIASPGRRTGNTVMAGTRWQWEEEVTESPIVKGLFIVEVRAVDLAEPVDDTRPVDKPTQQTRSETRSSTDATRQMSWTSTATGVLSSSRSEVRQAIAEPFTGNIQGGPGGQPGGPSPAPRPGAPSS